MPRPDLAAKQPWRLRAALATFLAFAVAPLSLLPQIARAERQASSDQPRGTRQTVWQRASQARQADVAQALGLALQAELRPRRWRDEFGLYRFCLRHDPSNEACLEGMAKVTLRLGLWRDHNQVVTQLAKADKPSAQVNVLRAAAALRAQAPQLAAAIAIGQPASPEVIELLQQAARSDIAASLIEQRHNGEPSVAALVLGARQGLPLGTLPTVQEFDDEPSDFPADIFGAEHWLYRGLMAHRSGNALVARDAYARYLVDSRAKWPWVAKRHLKLLREGGKP